MSEPITLADFENALQILRKAEPLPMACDYLPPPRYEGQKTNSYLGLPYVARRANGRLVWREADAAN